MKFFEKHSTESKQTENDKITDKTLTRSLITSIIGILVCMTSLVGLTWAWFSSSVVTSSNKITAASFELVITLKKQGGEEITKGENGYYVLDPSMTYEVSIIKNGSAKNAFCQLLVYSSDTSATALYTGIIPPPGKSDTVPYVFTLKGIPKIKFIPVWGNCPDEATIISYGAEFAPGAAENAKETTNG